MWQAQKKTSMVATCRLVSCQLLASISNQVMHAVSSVEFDAVSEASKLLKLLIPPSLLGTLEFSSTSPKGNNGNNSEKSHCWS
jgi:hypothetical protein